MRLLMCAALLSLTGAAFADDPKKEEEEAKGKIATLQAETLVKAVQTYYVQLTKWPKNLIEVAPFLVNGTKDLMDPWGKQYQYQIKEVKVNGDVMEYVYIWTERIVGKETKVYGKKPLEEKKEEKKP